MKRRALLKALAAIPFVGVAASTAMERKVHAASPTRARVVETPGPPINDINTCARKRFMFSEGSFVSTVNPVPSISMIGDTVGLHRDKTSSWKLVHGCEPGANEVGRIVDLLDGDRMSVVSSGKVLAPEDSFFVVFEILDF
jgi:hypothetical protein